MNQSANATDSASATKTALIGTWRLVEHRQERVESGEVSYPRGDHPRGYLTYTADGHFNVFNLPAKDDRPTPKGVSPTDAESLGLFKALTAYCGKYSFKDQSTVIHHVDIAWNETWGGTDQERRFVLQGDKLVIENGPIFSPWDGKRIIATMTYVRDR
jgi:hypothetical protein